MPEPDPKDISRLYKSFCALFSREGGNVYGLIRNVAESMAYQYAVRRGLMGQLKDCILERRDNMRIISRLTAENADLREQIRILSEGL